MHPKPKPLRFSKKDLAVMVGATALIVGSLANDDAWIVVPVLAVAWLAYIYLCVNHAGPLRTRVAVAFAITLFLGFVGVRKLASKEPTITFEYADDRQHVVPPEDRPHEIGWTVQVKPRTSGKLEAAEIFVERVEFISSGEPPIDGVPWRLGWHLGSKAFEAVNIYPGQEPFFDLFLFRHEDDGASKGDHLRLFLEDYPPGGTFPNVHPPSEFDPMRHVMPGMYRITVSLKAKSEGKLISPVLKTFLVDWKDDMKTFHMSAVP